MPKIKTIKFINHPIFKDTVFDFCTSNGVPADSVTLAGENGSGKTKLLEELHHGIMAEYHVDAPVRIQRQTIITLDLTDSGYYSQENSRLKVTTAQLIASSDSDAATIFRKVEFYHGTQLITDVASKNMFNRVVSFSMNSAYSGTEINYIPKTPVTNVTNQQLDSGVLSPTDDVAHEITQLIVDVASQDNDDVAQYVAEHAGRPVPAKIIHNLRMKRFTKAYKYMFGNELKYKTIVNNIHPIFEKDGHDFDITNLSSGEKQIVFRGAHLLRNNKNLVGAPVFIDEPEISMHPKWARTIYGYYKSLFTDGRGKQTSQIFTATHNEYVVDSAIHDDSSIILSICLDCNGYHKFSKELAGEILPTITLAEIKYFVYGIYSIDFHVQLYAYLQNTFVNTAAVRGIDDFLLHYKAPRKKSSFKTGKRIVEYHSLPTFIRNTIDHPDGTTSFSQEELEKSTDFMIALIRQLRANPPTSPQA